MLVKATHAEVGLKPQLSPRGHATKTEELKSVLMATELQIHIHPQCQCCELSACGMSKWMSTHTAQMGLVSATSGFVGTFTQRLGQVRI